MYRRTFALGLVASSFSMSCARAQERSGLRSFLRCHAHLDTDELVRGGSFTLSAVLECLQGGRSLFTPVSWGSGGMHVDIRSAEGEAILLPRNEVRVLPPQAFRDRSNFVELFSGMLIGAIRREVVSDYFDSPGQFTINVIYQSPALRSVTVAENAIVAEDGPVAAPPISMTVA